mmetsp:Transcript_28932/g.55320  ORF Transcript_28932/g.55320 Transcript_28932/m.55320 type:complete len:202 (-) Transcript_28932:674-1279(-)
MTGKKLQQPHDQRTGQAQQRRGKGDAHPTQLFFKPAHQAGKDGKSGLPVLRRKAPNGVHKGRHGCRQPIEGTQKAQENQKVDDISRDFTNFINTCRHRIEDRPGRRCIQLHPRPARAQQRGQGRQQLRRLAGRTHPFAGEPFDPLHRPDQLKHHPETGNHPDAKNKQDKAVQIRIGLKDRQNARQGQDDAKARQAKDNDHQ